MAADLNLVLVIVCFSDSFSIGEDVIRPASGLIMLSNPVRKNIFKRRIPAPSIREHFSR